MRGGELERPSREDVHCEDRQAAFPRGADAEVRGVGEESGHDDRRKAEKPRKALIYLYSFVGSQRDRTVCLSLLPLKQNYFYCEFGPLLIGQILYSI